MRSLGVSTAGQKMTLHDRVAPVIGKIPRSAPTIMDETESTEYVSSMVKALWRQARTATEDCSAAKMELYNDGKFASKWRRRSVRLWARATRPGERTVSPAGIRKFSREMEDWHWLPPVNLGLWALHRSRGIVHTSASNVFDSRDRGDPRSSYKAGSFMVRCCLKLPHEHYEDIELFYLLLQDASRDRYH